MLDGGDGKLILLRLRTLRGGIGLRSVIMAGGSGGCIP